MPNIANNLFSDIRVFREDDEHQIALKQGLLWEMAMGIHGVDHVAATSTVGGPFCCIAADNNGATVTATGEGISWSAVDLAAGQTIPGYFTSVTVSAGGVFLTKCRSAH